MNDSFLLADLIARSAAKTPAARALTHGQRGMSYAELQGAIESFVGGVIGLHRPARLRQ